VRDVDIRLALRLGILAPYLDDPCTRIIEELGIKRGEVRADIVVVNGETHGYEIKSTEDTLRRLRAQDERYSSVFDRVTLVTAARHMPTAAAMVPTWWGVIIANETANGIGLEFHRRGEENPRRDPRAAAEFLWRDETLRLLDLRGKARGRRDRPRWVLWDALCEAYAPDEVFAEVRRFLKERPVLSTHPQRPRNGASCPIGASSPD
jgi:hypothetical protein